MKCFNRKRLIPSLGASVMVAAATLAPLPSFLASGTVFAAPLGTIQTVSLGLSFSSPPAGSAPNDVRKYQCSPTINGDRSGSITIPLPQPTGPKIQTLDPPPAVCDDQVHTISIT